MGPLIVIVPGLGAKRAPWQTLMDRLAREPEFAGGQWMYRDSAAPSLMRRRDPLQLAVELRSAIDQEWIARGPYSRVVLAGHSLGGLIVRQAYLLAAGIDDVTSQRSPWVNHVSRIVLLASLNRGIDDRRRVDLRTVSWLGRLVPYIRGFLSWRLFRGSEFITNLRIQWIRHFDQLGDAAPLVIQVLGTRDELVERDDSVDVEQFPNARYLSVPEATHIDLHHIEEVADPEGRYALLREAFVSDDPSHAEKRTFAGPEHIVFVLHGIRANNHTWVREMVAAINERWPEVQPIGPRYEFVSALAFALPMKRRRYLRWFQDEYAERLAHNPQARFGFMGHSNGTYLFGESLKAIPGMRFEHAVLVGSVLPTDYDWDERARKGQIGSLRVDGSRHDVPVGWLCSGLRALNMKDIGTGGFEGFTSVTRAPHHEFFWYPGGHSAPLVSENLPALAEYAVTGQLVPPTGLAHESKWFSIVSRSLNKASPFVALAAIIALAVLTVYAPLVSLALLGALVVSVFVLNVV